MGVNRDGDREDEVISDFRDRRVCKAYLVGLCPKLVLSGTKVDQGACTLKHDDALRADYLKENARRDLGYGMDLQHELRGMINEVETKIQRANVRLGDGMPDGPPPNLDVEAEPEVATLALQVKAKEEEISKAAMESKPTLGLSDQLDGLKKEKADVQARVILAKMQKHEAERQASGNPPQKLRVCDICAALISVQDSHERVADHFAGRVHDGFLKIRAMATELRDAPPPARGDDRDDRGRDRDRDDRDSRRSRDRYDDRRGRDRDRGYDDRRYDDRRGRDRYDDWRGRDRYDSRRGGYDDRDRHR